MENNPELVSRIIEHIESGEDKTNELSNFKSIVKKNIYNNLGEAFIDQIGDTLNNSFSDINSSATITDMVEVMVNNILLNKHTISSKYYENINVDEIVQNSQQEAILFLFPGFKSIQDIYEYVNSLDNGEKIEEIEEKLKTIDDQIEKIYKIKTMSLEEINLYEKLNNNPDLVSLAEIGLNNPESIDTFDYIKEINFDFGNIPTKQQKDSIGNETENSELFSYLWKDAHWFDRMQTLKDSAENIDMIKKIHDILRYLPGCNSVKDLLNSWNEILAQQELLIELMDNRADLAIELENIQSVENYNRPKNQTEKTERNNETIISKTKQYIIENLDSSIKSIEDVENIEAFLLDQGLVSDGIKEILAFSIIEFIDPSDEGIMELYIGLIDKVEHETFFELVKIYSKQPITLDFYKKGYDKIIKAFNISPLFMNHFYSKEQLSLLCAQNKISYNPKKSNNIKNFAEKYINLDSMNKKDRLNLLNSNYCFSVSEKGLNQYSHKWVTFTDKVGNIYNLSEQEINTLGTDKSFEELSDYLLEQRAQAVNNLKNQTYIAQQETETFETVKNCQSLVDIVEKYNTKSISKNELLGQLEYFFSSLAEIQKNISLGKNISNISNKGSLIYVILSENEELFKEYFPKNSKNSSQVDIKTMIGQKKSELEKKIFKLFLGENYRIDNITNFDMSEISHYLSQNKTIPNKKRPISS